MTTLLSVVAFGVPRLSTWLIVTELSWSTFSFRDKSTMPWDLNILLAVIISLPFPASVMGTKTLFANGLPVDLKRFSASRNFSWRADEETSVRFLTEVMRSLWLRSVLENWLNLVVFLVPYTMMLKRTLKSLYRSFMVLDAWTITSYMTVDSTELSDMAKPTSISGILPKNWNRKWY